LREGPSGNRFDLVDAYDHGQLAVRVYAMDRRIMLKPKDYARDHHDAERLKRSLQLDFVVNAGESPTLAIRTMYMALAWLEKRCGASEVMKVWSACWLGNLVGSIALAGLIVVGVGGALFMGVGYWVASGAYRGETAPEIESAQPATA